MASVDMCEHDWPGSGCKECAAGRVAWRLGSAMARFPPGTRMRKKSGASWQGKVVGYYSTDLTEVGLAIESEREPGSVQIYPSIALEQI